MGPCRAALLRGPRAHRDPVLGVEFPPLEAPMHRAKFLVLAAVALSSISILGQPPTVTVFEGARIIVGDGRAPIENGTFIVSGNRFTQVSRAADAEARQAVREEAAKKVDIIKFWVDDRMGTVKKLPPELYTAIIDEAHKNRLRTISHIYALEDAKGTLRAGLDAFAHGVRDKDLDDEFMTLVKQHPNLVLGPNMPDRGVVASIDWLRQSLGPAEFETLQKANTNRPDAQAFWGIQARNLAKMSAAGVRIVVGTDGNTPYAAHVEMADMVAAGMTPMQVIVAATG